MNKISLKNYFQLVFFIFGLYFGAGNLLFPPVLGKESAAGVVLAWLGFCVTAIGLPLMSLVASTKTYSLHEMAGRVNRAFQWLFPILIYLAIGPGLAIPRAGSTPFEVIVAPYLADSVSPIIPRLIFTTIFFSLVYLLAKHPNQLVNFIGKYTIPCLLVLIVVLLVGVWRLPANSQTLATGIYQVRPAVGGFLAGYDTLDALTSLTFGMVVAGAFQEFGISRASVPRLTARVGLVSGLLLMVVYGLLAFIGHHIGGYFQGPVNGAVILLKAATLAIGTPGAVILGVIFTLACLNICIGLTTSIAENFVYLYPSTNYFHWVQGVIVMSFLLSNFGLDSIIKFSLPLLMIVYPLGFILVILELTLSWGHYSRSFYQWTINIALVISLVTVLDHQFKLTVPGLTQWMRDYLPLYDVQLGWALPFILLLGAWCIYRLLRPHRPSQAL